MSQSNPSVAGSAPVVDLDGVVAVLGSYPVLAGASMRVDAGEIVVVRGANGAGKSSLLRLCAGLLPVTRGRAMVCGVDLVRDRRAVATAVGLLGHSNGLYGDLSVAENIEFRAGLVGAEAAEVRAAMERLGVDGRLAEVPARRLSAGQRRRTALACLVVRRAQLWLLDEPHAGLDTAGRDVLDSVISDAARSGATVLVASHEHERSARLATRTVEIRGGGIFAADDPAEHPDTPVMTDIAGVGTIGGPSDGGDTGQPRDAGDTGDTGEQP
jgi:heme ABC exporter ATP-binding subunit CcmA